MTGGEAGRCFFPVAMLAGWLFAGGGPLEVVGEELGDLPSRQAELDGARVHYRSEGSGARALVFIHGWGCDLRVWRRQVPALSSRMRSLFIDLPGHGQSDKPEVEYSVGYLAEAVEAVVRHAAVREVILVGHSNGVPVARQYYRLYPRKTVALVAVEGGFRPLSADPGQIEGLIQPFREPTYLEAVDKMVPGNMGEDLREEIRSMMRATPQHVLVGTLEGVFDREIWSEDPIQIPTLVLLARSPFWTEEYEAFVRELVPGVTYRVYEGTGHFLQLQSSKLFNEAVLEFLEARDLIGD